MHYRSEGPNQTGIPWIQARAQLADAWHIPPWEVDESPMGEVEIQLELWAIEHKYRKKD